jgi:hypothetical protein
LNLQLIEQRVRQFNEFQGGYNVLVDAATNLAFQMPPNRDTIVPRARLLNDLWGTVLYPGELHLICERLVEHLPDIQAAISQTHGLALPTSPAEIQHIIDVGRRLSGLVLDVDLTRKRKNGKPYPYSPAVFSAKFAHWLCRTTLPIVDSRSEGTLIELTGGKDQGFFTSERKRECWLIHYENAIRFYNFALSQLTEAQRRQIVEFDLETQPRSIRTENTIVRILDKFLFEGQTARVRTNASQ